MNEPSEGDRLQAEAERKWSGHRISHACKVADHWSCSGTGVATFQFRGHKGDDPTTCLDAWTCACRCHWQSPNEAP